MSSSRAENTRVKILDAANRLLLEKGYHGVGLESVAEAAGVSRQTLYDRFGSKGGLVKAMIARNEEQAQLPERLGRVFSQTDGLRMLRAFLDTVTAVEPQVYPQSRLVYGARMSDPVAAELWQWRLDSRRAGLGRVFELLAAEGRLKPGINRDEAADVAWAIASPHHYEYLVVERGWSLRRYRKHLEQTIVARLLNEV